MRTFQAMFNIASGASSRTISFENGESTTIPVVLELDVKPAENQAADVASDPAVEAPEANPSTDEKAKTEGQNLGVTGVEGTEEDPTLPEVSLEDEVAMAEAEAEKNELVNEVEVVEDTVEKIEEDAATIKETLDANDAAVAAGGEDQINAANVAIATQSLELRLERLGLNLRDLSSSANISKETFLSKEQGGMGLKPSDVLRNLHNDICREDGVLDKIKAGAKAVWEAIVKTLRKIYDFFFLNDKRLIARLEKLQEEFLDVPPSLKYKIDLGKIAPVYAYMFNKTSYKDFNALHKVLIENTKHCIELNNELVKTINTVGVSDQSWGAGIRDKVMSTRIKIDDYFVNVVLKDKLVGVASKDHNQLNMIVDKLRFETFVPKDLKDHVNYEIDINNAKWLVKNAILVMKNKESIRNDMKKMIDNLEKLTKNISMKNHETNETKDVTSDNVNSFAKSYFTKVATNIEKSMFDYGVVAEAVAREGIKAGKGAAKNADTDQAKQ